MVRQTIYGVKFERYKGIVHHGHIDIYHWPGKGRTRYILCIPDLGIQYDYTDDMKDDTIVSSIPNKQPQELG